MSSTLASKVAAAIVLQQAEVDRLTAVATVNLPAAQVKLMQLTQLATRVTPAIETMLSTLTAAGIRLDD